MILSCPACSTRFIVADSAFGTKPRRVRCGKCRHDWLAEPPPLPEPVALSETYLQMETPPQAEVPAAEITPPPAEPAPIPEGSNLPVPLRSAFWRRALILLALLLSIAALGGLYLYATATGKPLWFAGTPAPQLSIEDVKTSYVEVTPDDAAAPKGWALVVEGNIRNKGGELVTLPPLVLATKDATGALIKLYRPDVQLRELPPGGVTGFTYRLTDVSERMAEVTVEFGSGLDLAPPATPEAAPQQAASQPAAPEAQAPARPTAPEAHSDGGH